MQEGTLKMSDDEIRKQCKESVGILYGFNTYGCSVKHINELCEAVHQDYTDIKDEDIEVWYILPSQSIRHARSTMLWVKIPIENFIKLRKEGKINIV